LNQWRHNGSIQHHIRHQALQLRVLGLELLEPIGVRKVHPAILGLQLVERRRAQTVLTAKLGGRQTGLLLFDHPDNLFVGAYAAPSGATVPSSSVKRLFRIRLLLKVGQTLHQIEGTSGRQVTSKRKSAAVTRPRA
jgi:hypothetical protein